MMKNENFDEELKNLIKQIFEKYNDSAADEGWNLLREKYPEKKRRDSFFWWGFIMALLLIALIFGLFEADFFQSKTFKTTKKPVIDTVSILPNPYSSTKKFTATRITADTSNTKKTSVKTASGFADERLSKTNKIVQNQIYTDTTSTQKTLIKTASSFVTMQNLQHKTELDNQNNASFTGINMDSVKSKNQQKLTIVLKDSSAQKTLVVVTKKANPAFAKPAVKKIPETETLKKVTKKSNVFSFGLHAGLHINYANGSNKQLGLGAGFSTDFRLSKNFKLSTGLGLLENKLTYKQDIPSTSLSAANSNYSAMPTTAIGFVTSIQNPILSSLNTRLVALDIPVNLVYNFSTVKNSISISGGISSNTFVKEAYDYHYSNSTSSTQNITSFNNFNFAKTLNLAVGFAFPLDKNLLQVEPFLKYPLGGLGSQQLQFGSAGINLKMNIQSLKK